MQCLILIQYILDSYVLLISMDIYFSTFERSVVVYYDRKKTQRKGNEGHKINYN